MRGLLVLNGEWDVVLPSVEEYSYVIVCDGAYERAKTELKRIDMVVGDFDSLNYVPDSVPTLIFDCEKNQTDSEIALSYLIEKGVDEIDIYWALQGRVDHTLGNFTLLKKALDQGIVASIKGEKEEIYLINELAVLDDVLGLTISLLPYSDSAHILKTEGLKYPPDGLLLTKGDTRGISNVAIKSQVEIFCKDGEVLLIINKEGV